jgi:hypothetical protein
MILPGAAMALLLATAAAPIPPAVGDGGPEAPVLTVRVVAGDGARAAAAFFRAELLGQGFAVEERAAAGPAGRDLFATVVPDPTTTRVRAEVTLHGRGLVEVVDLGPVSAGNEVRLRATLAVRVSELLRARARELGLPPPAPRQPAPPPPARLRLDLFVGVGRVLEEVGLAGGPELGLSWRPPRGPAVRLTAGGLLIARRLTAGGGSAAVTQSLALVEVGPEARGRLAPSLALGAGLCHVLARGSARPGYLARAEASLSPAASAAGSVSLPLTGALSLTAAARLLHLFGAPRVQIADEQVGHVPFLSWQLAAGLRVGF